ncbi:MAG: diguanylate cyclase [Thermodesulfobacteriota bacterium]|jgi:GGDEF domain-containing protein
MENLGGEFPKGTEAAFGRVLNRDLFLFLLDLEVKRARRYQNFLCLMLLKIKPFLKEDDGGGLQACHQILSNLLMEEIRESDIIGSLKLDKLAVLLPYADVKAGDHVKSRFEDALKYYDFKSKGVEVMIDQVCFPIDGTDTTDLIKRALAEEPS